MRLNKIGDEIHITLENAEEIGAYRSRFTGHQLGSISQMNLAVEMGRQFADFLDGKTECTDHQPFYCENGSRFCANCGRPME